VFADAGLFSRGIDEIQARPRICLRDLWLFHASALPVACSRDHGFLGATLLPETGPAICRNVCAAFCERACGIAGKSSALQEGVLARLCHYLEFIRTGPAGLFAAPPCLERRERELRSSRGKARPPGAVGASIASTISDIPQDRRAPTSAGAQGISTKPGTPGIIRVTWS